MYTNTNLLISIPTSLMMSFIIHVYNYNYTIMYIYLYIRVAILGNIIHFKMRDEFVII